MKKSDSNWCLLFVVIATGQLKRDTQAYRNALEIDSVEMSFVGTASGLRDAQSIIMIENQYPRENGKEPKMLSKRLMLRHCQGANRRVVILLLGVKRHAVSTEVSPYKTSGLLPLALGMTVHDAFAESHWNKRTLLIV